MIRRIARSPFARDVKHYGPAVLVGLAVFPAVHALALLIVTL